MSCLMVELGEVYNALKLARRCGVFLMKVDPTQLTIWAFTHLHHSWGSEIGVNNVIVTPLSAPEHRKQSPFVPKFTSSGQVL